MAVYLYNMCMYGCTVKYGFAFSNKVMHLTDFLIKHTVLCTEYNICIKCMHAAYSIIEHNIVYVDWHVQYNLKELSVS